MGEVRIIQKSEALFQSFRLSRDIRFCYYTVAVINGASTHP